jgi:hypothetical protein
LTEIFPSNLQNSFFLRANCRDYIRKDTKITVGRKHMDTRRTHMEDKCMEKLGIR